MFQIVVMIIYEACLWMTLWQQNFYIPEYYKTYVDYKLYKQFAKVLLYVDIKLDK